MTLAYLTLASMLCGAMLLLRDYPVVEGCILASGAGERRSVRLLLPLLIAAGPGLLILTGDRTFADACPAILAVPFQNALALVIATAAAGIISNLISPYPAVPYAFTGAIFGLDLAENGTFAAGSALTHMSSWIAAFVLCAIFAAGFWRLYSACTGKRRIHLARLDSRLLALSTLVSFILIAAYSLNTGSIAAFFAVTGSAEVRLAALIIPLSYLALFFILRRRTYTSCSGIADNELEINSESVLSVLCAITATLVIFSTRLPSFAGMSATPLSACSLYLAALTGLGIARKSALTDETTLYKHLAAAILSPVLGVLFAYSLASILGGDMVSTLIVAGIILLAALVSLYLRIQKGRDLQRQIMRSREQQIYSNQKSLSALEVRSEMNEKELLEKLELKRKELVDFAVGISSQKEFMDDIYARLGKMRAMPDGPDKDAATDEILHSLRERMYFASEVNDFYARSEVLHKDFNMRLREAFPGLTENERKLANLLRQGLSTKHIASLMNITPKSVEINRYRLRSKLGLDHGENLTKFIKSI